MLGCFLFLLVAAVIAVIIILLFEWVIGMLVPGIPAQIFMLIRVLVGIFIVNRFLAVYWLRGWS